MQNLSSSRLATIGTGIVVLIIIAIVALVPSFRSTFVSWYTFAFAPQEVERMLFLTGSDAEHLSLSTVRFGLVKNISYPDKTFVEVVQAKNDTIALLKDTSGKTDVYAIDSKGGATALTTDGQEKQNLVVSPDDSRIVFSYVKASSFKGKLPEGVSLDTLFDVNRYQLASLDRTTGKITEEGNGLYAHFIDAQTLFYVSAKGFVVKDIATGDAATYADGMVFRMTTAPVFVSSDSFVVQNPLLPQFDVFKIVSRTPLRLALESTLSGFDGTKVYALASNEMGTSYGLSQVVSGGTITLLGSKEGTEKTSSFTFPSDFTPYTLFIK